DDEEALRRLGRSMGFLKSSAAGLQDQWQRHRVEVRRLHQKLFYRPLLSAVARIPGEEARLSPEAARDRLAALGVGYHNPHQWFVDYFPDRAREMAATTDPQGLLNPGKLVKPDVDTGTKPSVALTDDTTDDEAGAW
ncbi:hypothetical protein, partial [uncultured Microbacterium sp.]|uniref:hypothetical protein n=1 Tax=uncultured Microbacterium sp. TaxID=191216 RepID=UPI002586E389